MYGDLVGLKHPANRLEQVLLQGGTGRPNQAPPGWAAWWGNSGPGCIFLTPTPDALEAFKEAVKAPDSKALQILRDAKCNLSWAGGSICVPGVRKR